MSAKEKQQLAALMQRTFGFITAYAVLAAMEKMAETFNQEDAARFGTKVGEFYQRYREGGVTK